MPYWLDGNNLIGRSVERARTEPGSRREFLSFLGTCSSTRGGRFVVFFDGDDPDRIVPPSGVRIRFSAPLSTDDAIVNELAGCRTPSEVIVVTNDRSLAARCRDCGAKTMGWQEFMAKVNAGSRPRRENRSRDASVNVDEWIRYFHLDKESIE